MGAYVANSIELESDLVKTPYQKTKECVFAAISFQTP